MSWTCRTAAALALAATSANAATASDGVAEGQAAMRWLKKQPCPTLGSPLDVPGLQTPAEVARVRTASLDYGRRQADALLTARASRDRVVGERQAEGKDAGARRRGLAALDAAIASGVGRMSATLVRWLLAEWAEVATLSPATPVAAGTPHPLAPFVAREHEVEGLVRRMDGLPGVDGLLVPLVQRAHVCLLTAQNQVVEANADGLLALAADATAPAPIEQALARYAVVDAGFGAGVPDLQPPAVVGTLREQIAELRAQESTRLAQEQEKANAANAAKRAALAEQARQDLAVARRFTALLRARTTAPMRPLLHPDVVLSGPSGSRNGRGAVVDALAQILGQSQGFSVGEAQLDPSNLAITAVATSSRGQGHLRFRFTGGLISQLLLQR